MGIQNKKRNHYSAINYKKKEYNLDKIHIGCVSNMIYKTQIVFCLTILTQIINAFKTGMESGLICYQCLVHILDVDCTILIGDGNGENPVQGMTIAVSNSLR